MAPCPNLQQSAQEVADGIRKVLCGFDGYRKYICDEFLCGAVFWSMDDGEVEKFMDLDAGAKIKRGHALLIKQLKTSVTVGAPPEAAPQGHGVVPPRGNNVRKVPSPATQACESRADPASPSLPGGPRRHSHIVPEENVASSTKSAKTTTVHHASTSSAQKPTKAHANRRQSSHQGNDSNHAQEEEDCKQDGKEVTLCGQPTSYDLYTRPVQCGKYESVIGKPAIRNLRDKFRNLKAIVEEELEELPQDRLRGMNFKKNREDREWREAIYASTMEATDNGEFEGSNGILYKWPRGMLCLSGL
jgi:hypothetical protein